MGRPPKVTEETITAIRSNLRRKVPQSLQAMAMQLNVSPSTVYRVQTRHHWKSKIQSGWRRVTEATILEIRKLLRNPDNGVHAIRKRTGAGIGTISKIRDTLGPLPQVTSPEV
jgi:Helix-turn-helix domain of resolvase